MCGTTSGDDQWLRQVCGAISRAACRLSVAGGGRVWVIGLVVFAPVCPGGGIKPGRGSAHANLTHSRKQQTILESLVGECKSSSKCSGVNVGASLLVDLGPLTHKLGLTPLLNRTQDKQTY